MRRLLDLLPWLGLGLIALAVSFRQLREEGLGLQAFPPPPSISIAAPDISRPDGALSGRLADPSGSPIAEALVSVAFDDELAWTYSDVRGRFELPHVPLGALQVEVVAREFRTEIFPVSSPAAELELVMDEPVAAPPDLPPIERAELRGRVSASVGRRGLLGFEVLLQPASALHEYGQPIPVRARVGADRSFRFPGLMYGEYRVSILPPWAAGGSWPNLCSADDRLYVHGPSAGELELRMAAGEVQARVLNEDGDAIQGAVAVLTPLGTPLRPWPPESSAADGTLIFRDLAPGRYRLELSAGQGSRSEEVEVVAGHTSVLDLPPLRVRSDPH
jgi:hypothetical protein